MCQELLNQLVNHENAWPFRKPVDPKQVRDYYEIIKQPMGKSLACLKSSNHCWQTSRRSRKNLITGLARASLEPKGTKTCRNSPRTSSGCSIMRGSITSRTPSTTSTPTSSSRFQKGFLTGCRKWNNTGTPPNDIKTSSLNN
jgi:hypothetical protein